MIDRNSLFESKLMIIQKDIEETFSIYNNSKANINTLRGWSLTISLAYFGFLITIQTNNYLLLLPYILFQFFFMYLEATKKDNMDEASSSLYEIKSIFLETDQNKFESVVLAYKFRGYPRPSKRSFISFKRTCKRIKKIFISPELLWWYLVQFILLFLGIYALKNGIFIISKT